MSTAHGRVKVEIEIINTADPLIIFFRHSAELDDHDYGRPLVATALDERADAFCNGAIGGL